MCDKPNYVNKSVYKHTHKCTNTERNIKILNSDYLQVVQQ